MQPGYGAPEINQHQQQLIADDCSPSIFTMSNPHLYQPRHHSQQLQHFQQRKQQRQQQMCPQHEQQQPSHFISFTQHLLHPQQQQQQFQTFQQQQSDRLQHHQPGLDQQETLVDVNFKLGLNENSGNKGNDRVNHDDGIFLQGNISGIQQQSRVMPHSWRSQDDSVIKQHFWCRNKQCDQDKQQETECNKNKNYSHTLQQVDQNKERCKNVGTKYKHSGELEAIYGPTNAKIFETKQSGSESAVTGENSPKDADAVFFMPLRDIQCKNICKIADANTAIGVDRGSENSIGEDSSLEKVNEEKKRKRKINENFGSMVEFFEQLVKRVMDHQDGLFRNLLEIVQRMDKERNERDEAWRRQETAMHNREEIARSHEKSISSNREALMVSYIEKITGQRINLLPRENALLLQPEVKNDQTKDLTAVKSDTNNRWPKAEVEDLIHFRGRLEPRFLESGLKGPLWEEVSSLMASRGYQRSAKRCKEKWENINKYYRKAKQTGKKRSSQSKTCPYFDQLDQLYSGTPINLPSSSNPSFTSDMEVKNQRYSELLEAYIAERDVGIAQNTFNDSEMGSLRLNFDGIGNNQTAEF